MKLYQKWVLLISLIILQVPVSMANIAVGASRIIYLASESGKSIDISNRSHRQPYLISVGIDDNLTAKSASSVFMPTPALFRIEPDADNKIRILKKSDGLPQDRESVSYLTITAIPTGKAVDDSKKNSVGGNLQVATGNTVKLFYRPDNLPITQKEAMGKLQFSREGQSTRVTNPTPYFISLNKLTIDGKKVPLDVIKGTSMISPYASRLYPVSAVQGNAQWVAINDFGGTETFHGALH